MQQIFIQYGITKKNPSSTLLKRWAKAALNKKSSELTIRIVGKKEMTQLNKSYRQKDGPTNVLAFPLENDMLGDIVICADVVLSEAKAQQKQPKAHWAHMVVHGTLHLLGYDHVKEKDAIKMEKKEIQILKSLGFKNPYKV